MAGPYRSPYRLVIVDAAGARYGTLTDARIDSCVWELNAWGSLAFHLSTTHPHAALCIPTQREVQLWYEPASGPPRCIWWGPIISREAQQDGTTSVQAVGLLWYLSRIQMGPVLTNYLTDPNFEDATLAHWTATGATKSSETTIVRAGSRSMKLVSAAAGLDQYAYQQFTYNNSGGLIPEAVVVRAYFYFVNTAGTPEIGNAFMERGLFVQTIESAVVQEAVWAPINTSAPRNQWVRIFAPPVVIPAGHTQTVEVRCYSPGGTIFWDTSMAAQLESTGANTANTYADINTILANILTYAQDTTKNKTALHITGPAGSFGVTLTRQFQFYDHGFVWDAAIKPLIDAGYCDLDITWNAAATTRALTTYTTQGAVKPQLALTLGGNATIYAHHQDGQQTAGAISVLPQSLQGETTIGKEQKAAIGVGYAVDTAANGGICFDELISATPESSWDSISQQATTELARRKNLVTSPAWAVSAEWALNNQLAVGDTVPFRGSWGWVSANENRRIATLQLVPEQSNTMVVTGTTTTY